MKWEQSYDREDLFTASRACWDDTIGKYSCLSQQIVQWNFDSIHVTLGNPNCMCICIQQMLVYHMDMQDTHVCDTSHTSLNYTMYMSEWSWHRTNGNGEEKKTIENTEF